MLTPFLADKDTFPFYRTEDVDEERQIHLSSYIMSH